MPIDANIAMGVKPIEIESPLNSLAKMLQVQDMQQVGQLNRLKMDEYGRGVQRSNALQSLLQADYANPEARQSAMLKGGFLKEAQEYGKGNSDLAKTNMEVSKGEADILDKTLSSFRSYVPQINSPEAAGQYTAAMYDHPVLGKYAAQFGTREDVIRRNVEKFQQDPRAWAVGSAGISADKLLESLKGTRQNTNMGGTSQGQTTNYYGEVVPGSTTNTPITQSADSKATERSAAAGRQVQREGQELTRQRLDFDKTKPATPRATSPMSVTLQKELLESDDAVQSGKAIVSTLQNALKINKDAYSGYAAKGRAVLASNVPFVGKDGANATIDLDNMMTGQALESLKTVFGGMPTEGERKILLDMQASADKTPEQREAIIKRAISAAERRAAYAGQKAKSIRGGTYLTDGAPTEAPTADPLDSLLDKYK